MLCLILLISLLNFFLIDVSSEGYKEGKHFNFEYSKYFMEKGFCIIFKDNLLFTSLDKKGHPSNWTYSFALFCRNFLYYNYKLDLKKDIQRKEVSKIFKYPFLDYPQLEDIIINEDPSIIIYKHYFQFFTKEDKVEYPKYLAELSIESNDIFLPIDYFVRFLNGGFTSFEHIMSKPAEEKFLDLPLEWQGVFSTIDLSLFIENKEQMLLFVKLIEREILLCQKKNDLAWVECYELMIKEIKKNIFNSLPSSFFWKKEDIEKIFTN
jgi:hypothetical protein